MAKALEDVTGLSCFNAGILYPAYGVWFATSLGYCGMERCHLSDVTVMGLDDEEVISSEGPCSVRKPWQYCRV